MKIVRRISLEGRRSCNLTGLLLTASSCKKMVSGDSMARLVLTARNAAVFFVHGPGRRLSTHDFWQFVRTFPVDLQWEVCLELGEERLVLCVVPTATAEVRVSGCLMRPPFEDVMLSLLSLSFPLRQELLQHLELPDLAFLVSTCSELHEVVMNQ